MMRRAPHLALPLLAALALVGSACGGGGGGGAGGNAVSATLGMWYIKLDPSSAGSGEVTFRISNQDPDMVHEFVVFKTDLAEDALPVTADQVNEDSPDLTLVGEKEDIAPGDSADLTVDLDAGNYVVICNITGHYSKGMHASFTVS